MYTRTFKAGAIGYSFNEVLCLSRLAAYREDDFSHSFPKSDELNAATATAADVAIKFMREASGHGDNNGSVDASKKSKSKKI
jgi:hypothetical protein